MESQDVAKSGDKLPVPALPSTSQTDSAKPRFLSDGSKNDAVALQSSGTVDSSMTPMASYIIDQIVSEANSTLKYLEYLNSDSTLTVFTAFEKLSEGFSGLVEDFSRIEVLLAKENIKFEDIARVRVALEHYSKVLVRCRPVLDMICNLERAIGSATILTSSKNELCDEQSEGSEKKCFPLFYQCYKIIEEMTRRIEVWDKKLKERFIELMEKKHEQGL